MQGRRLPLFCCFLLHLFSPSLSLLAQPLPLHLPYNLPTLGGDSLELFSANLTLPYIVKKSWVENFIKFNLLYEARSTRPKITAIGCVPSNTKEGSVLAIGERLKEHDFLFSCEQDPHGVLSYEAIGCVDNFGNIMQIGEARRLSNGTVILHCSILGGVVKKVAEKAAGCLFNETIYGEDETWVQPLNYNSSHRLRRPRIERRQAAPSGASPPGVTLRGRLMQCYRPHYNFYEKHLIGCVVGKFGIRIDEYAQVQPGVFVKCIEKDNNDVDIVSVSAEDVSCSVGNDTMADGSVWIDKERAAEFVCNTGNVSKKGCILGTKKVPLGKEVRISNGCVFACHPAANVYMCEKVLGDSEVVEEEGEPGISYMERRFPFDARE